MLLVDWEPEESCFRRGVISSALASAAAAAAAAAAAGGHKATGLHLLIGLDTIKRIIMSRRGPTSR